MSKTDTPLEFIGTSRDDLSEFPTEVKYCIGFALRTAQKGGKHPDAKPLKGFKGAGVLEIVSDFDGNTLSRRLHGENKRRNLRASRISEEIQEGHRDAKSRAGQDRAQIERSRASESGERAMKKVRVTKSSGNVFADIGLPNAAEHSIKADLVLRIAARIKSKGLTQAKAASLLGLAQPDVSKLLRG